MKDEYAITFHYISWFPSANQNEDIVTVYADGHPKTEEITVRRSQINSEEGLRYIYNDNYLEVMSTEAFKEELLEHIEPGNGSYTIVANLISVNEEVALSDDKTGLLSSSEAEVDILFSDEDYTRESVMAMASKLLSYMKLANTGKPSTFRFYLTDKENVSSTNGINLTETKETMNYTARYDVYVHEGEKHGECRMADIK